MSIRLGSTSVAEYPQGWFAFWLEELKNSKSTFVKSAVCEAISALSSRCRFLLEDHKAADGPELKKSKPNTSESDAMDTSGSKSGFDAATGSTDPIESKDCERETKGSNELLTVLLETAESSKTEPKVVEATLKAISSICVGQKQQDVCERFVPCFYGLAKERKEEEIQFSAGENLVRCLLMEELNTFSTLELKNLLDASRTIDEDIQALLLDTRRMPFLKQDKVSAESTISVDYFNGNMEKMILLCRDSRPNTRAAGCIYLYTLLKHSKVDDQDKALPNIKIACDSVQKKLEDIQRSFAALLGDRSDLVQQLATRGLSLAYEQSDSSHKAEMVSSLVKSLTSGKTKATATTVAGDEGGVLELEGVGSDGSAATYKELCGVCNDMGKPELIYRFMDLAGHAALWNSRRGAALVGEALSSSSEAAEYLKEYLPDLIPRLYVMSYDPGAGVGIAMNKMLQSVCSAGGFGSIQAAVTAYLEVVISHTVSSLGQSQWRVRQAAFMALRDLLSSRKYDELKNDIETMWSMCFRGIDDIKETVRTAATSLGKSLSSVSSRFCDSELSGRVVADEACVKIGPIMLAAMVDKVKEIRALAFETLSKIIKQGGESLKPSVPSLMKSMLEATTELEPAILNYAQFHIEDKDELESMRAKAAAMSNSPIIDSLERLVALVDDGIAKEVAVELARLSRSGIGIPTRTATARMFSSLVVHRPQVIKPYAGKMMATALKAAASEKSRALRNAWAIAVGNTARLASLAAVTKMMDELAELSTSENTNDRELCCAVLSSLNQKAPDVLKGHVATVLPLAFVGQFEPTLSSMPENPWKILWHDSVSNEATGLRLYGKEIFDASLLRLENAQYAVKRTGCLAIKGACELISKIDSGLEQFVPLLTKATVSLGDLLPGRLWEHKENVLEAIESIGDVVNSLPEALKSQLVTTIWRQASGGASNFVELLLRESCRGKSEYRTSGILALAKTLKSVRDSDTGVLRQVLTAFGEDLSPATDATDEPNDETSVQGGKKAAAAKRVAIILCIESAIPSDVSSTPADDFDDALFALRTCAENFDGEIRSTAVQAAGDVLARLAGATPEARERCGTSILVDALRLGLVDGRQARTRRRALEGLSRAEGALGAERVRGELEACEGMELLVEVKEHDVDEGVKALASELWLKLS
mmetsp:Transcript_7728/g.19131  ORF Transcript_7728/g.19131 Transcript_7728/m.19131 type:complete len:1166 (+) Transcript_7728:1539-5036(+)